MAKVIRRQWQADLDSGLPRKDCRSCAFEAYVPDPLVGRPLTLDGDVAADVADAERAVTELDVAALTLVDTEALARLLLRAESVASSKIEGLEIETTWRERLGSVRANFSVDLLLRVLPGAPIITVNGAAKLLGRSFVATNNAIDRLVASGILQQVTLDRRNRAFEAPDVIQAFNDLERQLASPGGDTRMSPPARTVPRRR